MRICAKVNQNAIRFALALQPLFKYTSQCAIDVSISTKLSNNKDLMNYDGLYVEWGSSELLNLWQISVGKNRVVALPEIAAFDLFENELIEVLQSATRIVVYHEAIREYMLDYYPQFNKQVVVLKLQPYIEFVKKAMIEDITPQYNHFVSVGQIEWQRGYEFAVDAIGMARKLGIEMSYTIIGKGPYMDAIIYAARQWDLWRTPQFQIQALDSVDKWISRLRHSHALIYPSIEADDGVLIQLAHSLGVPVISIARNATAIMEALIRSPVTRAQYTLPPGLPINEFVALWY